MTQADVQLLQQAYDRAIGGRGSVEPNPMVGCVIARERTVIGQGHHARFGGPHAEPAALAACVESPRGATAYVTLEPCCHTAKKTPPCVPRLIEAGIRRVVVGCLDPNPLVDGRGVALLRSAGVVVDVAPPPVSYRFRQLIAPFAWLKTTGRSWRTMKWAQTSDGYIANPGGGRLQISGPAATRLVHDLRARSDAIVVGLRTVLRDDPMLTARHTSQPPRTLTRVILDPLAMTPPTSRLIATARQHPTLLIHLPPASDEVRCRIDRLQGSGVELLASSPDRTGRRLDIGNALDRLTGSRFAGTLIEPGPTLASAAIEHVERLWVIRSQRRLNDLAPLRQGGVDPSTFATRAVEVPSHLRLAGRLNTADGDELLEYLNPARGAFATASPSADVQLAARAT